MSLMSMIVKLSLLLALLLFLTSTFPFGLILISLFLLRLYKRDPEVSMIVKLIDLKMRFDYFLMGVNADRGFNPTRFKIAQAINNLLGGAPPRPKDPPNTAIFNLKVKSQIDDSEIPMRIFIRESALKSGTKLPIIFYLFPGGFHTEVPLRDPTELMDLGAMVVTISYRLAPKFKFPTQIEDSYSCLSFIAKKSHPILQTHWDERLILQGASAGGGVAAGSALLVRDRGLELKIVSQVLCCPALFYTDKGLPSQIKYRDWYFHGELSIKYINSMVVRDVKDYENPYLCPLKAPSLKGLPETYFVLGERDYFCSEAELYGQKLLEAGVKTDIKIYPGEHGFDASPSPVGRKARAETLEYLKKVIQG